MKKTLTLKAKSIFMVAMSAALIAVYLTLYYSEIPWHAMYLAVALVGFGSMGILTVKMRPDKFDERAVANQRRADSVVLNIVQWGIMLCAGLFRVITVNPAELLLPIGLLVIALRHIVFLYYESRQQETSQSSISPPQ